ncbi:MAG: motility-associated protein [Opitutales bacterium]|jgi:chemotaxis protein MotA
MLLLLGYFIVLVATLGGFIVGGGNPMLLLHVSEFIVIGGIGAGLLVVASPASVLKQIIGDTLKCIKGGTISADEYEDLLKLLYEIFMIGRRNGLIALDEHVTSPEESSIFNKYPSILKDHHRVNFLRNALRPIIDGKIKPDQLQDLLSSELDTMEDEAHQPVDILNLVGDSLPGIGIVAAVLGIINTMASIAEGPEAVGEKVAAALTGTFLGVLSAYGFVNPLAKRIAFLHKGELMYFNTMAKAISGFARGLAPIMAVEIARRGLDSTVKPDAEELEKTLKALNSTTAS